MIVLVGPDRCGKTTFSMELQEVLPNHFRYHHTKPPEGLRPYDYFGRFLCSTRTEVIVDRLHYCERAYGNAIRGESKLNPIEWLQLELMLKAHDATVVYMYDDYENIKSRWEKDEMFNVECMKPVLEEYEKMSSCFHFKVKLTDVFNDDRLTDLGLEIANTVNKPNRKFPPALGIGSYGHVLIVGDKPSADNRQGGAVCPFREGFSSDLLWEALMECDPNKMFITNASAFFDSAEFYDFVEREGQFKKIIALGDTAERMAGLCDNVVKLKHPSHVRRFLSKQQPEWIAELRKEVNS